MHRYCRRLVHWNLPKSPLALEQREGRVDRYLSLGVRTNIARLAFPPHPQGRPFLLVSPWELLVTEARRQAGKTPSVLAPLWHFGSEQPIQAIAINIPFSREVSAWQRLLQEASWYRLVLGQSDPRALLQRLSNGADDNHLKLKGVQLDLRPPLVEDA